MACDRLDIEFSATIEWKATPRRVLILMTQHSGICHFSKNSNYNMEECGQFVYVWCRQLREKNPRTVDTVHQVHELSLVFPVQKRPLQTQIPPTSPLPTVSNPRIPVFPSPSPAPFSSHSLSGEVYMIFFLIAFSIAVLTTEQYWWSSWY